MSETTTASESHTAAQPARRSLLPFFFANLLAVYVPGLLPTVVQATDRDAAPLDGTELRMHLIGFLDAPYRWLGLRVHLPILDRDVLGFDGGMFMLAPWLGNLGSFYVLLFGLWFVVLGLTLAGRNDKRRHWITFLLFVIFAVQAIFVTWRILLDRQVLAAPQVEEPGDGPVLPGPQPALP